MNQLDDTTAVRHLMAPHDPMPRGPSDDEIAAVRARVRAPRRSTLPLVTAAAAVLLLAIAVVPLVRAPAVWAIEESPDLGLGIRVELPEFFQRGPDPDGVVSALRDEEVAVTVRYNRDLTPWKAGRIVGLSADYGDLPRHLADELSEAMRPGGRQTVDVDLSEVGIDHHPDGGFTVYPDRFTGDVTLVVAVAPWQREPPPKNFP